MIDKQVPQQIEICVSMMQSRIFQIWINYFSMKWIGKLSSTCCISEFLDSTDTSIAFAVFGASHMQSFPIAAIAVSPKSETEEFLLCFNGKSWELKWATVFIKCRECNQKCWCDFCWFLLIMLWIVLIVFFLDHLYKILQHRDFSSIYKFIVVLMSM